MSKRKEDFIEAGIEYRFKHGVPNAIGGGALAEMVREINRAKPFEAGAEYGYQYAKKRIAEILLCIELSNFFPTLDENEEIAKGRKKLIDFVNNTLEDL